MTLGQPHYKIITSSITMSMRWSILIVLSLILMKTQAFNLSLIYQPPALSQIQSHQILQIRPLAQLHRQYIGNSVFNIDDYQVEQSDTKHKDQSSYSQTLIQNMVSSETKISPIYISSQLQHQYNDTEFDNLLTCSNGELFIIQYNKTQLNHTIELKYTGLLLTPAGVSVKPKFDKPTAGLLAIQYDPQAQPPTNYQLQQQQSSIVHADRQYGQSISASGTILVYSGCLGELTDKNTYFNKIDIILQGNSTLDNSIDSSNDNNYNKDNPWRQFRFSLLINCDHGGRNKKFEYGYMVIAFINAAITIGVAMHSRIWSIRYNQRPLSIELKWPRFLIGMLAIVAMGSAIFLYAKDQFINANKILKYSGLAVAYFYAFICSDQILFLVRKFKQEIYKMIRICDILSVIAATAMFLVGLFIDSWVYSNILAIGICVGAIKLFRFSNMKQAYLSMAISVIIVGIVAIVLHFVLSRSYNDYGSELSSPFFILIPDLIDELYKKCSWLPIIDVIVPGVFLSFLRTYDQNYNTGWGGVYTLIGNLSFILSTLLWVLLQAVYPYSIPFCLITYTILGLSVFLISNKRNQFKTLWTGRFNGANNELSLHLLQSQDEHNKYNIIGESDRKSFSKLVTSDIIDAVKYDANNDEESGEHEDQLKVNKGSI